MAVMFAFRCDGEGDAKPIDVSGRKAEDLVQEKGFVWIHLNRPEQAEMDWLKDCGLDFVVREALDAPETRPRCSVHEEGLLINLRGVNLAEGAEPEDMVSLRIWASGGLVVSLQRRNLLAVSDVHEAFARNMAPRDAGELVSRLALRLADRAEPIVAELNEQIDDLEDAFEATGEPPARSELADVRRVSIMLRRYMYPQKDALSTFAIEDMPWISAHARERLREATERVTRLTEALDAIRDRAEVVHDQIMDLRAEATNRQMLVLSVVTAIFLPLSLLTGLLGINVGGIPGAADGNAFWVVCGLLVVLAILQYWVFRRIGLLK